MATLKQLQIKAETELGFEVSETDVLIASYLCHGMSRLEISKTLGVEESELESLLTQDEFKAIQQIVQLEKATSKADIDGGWDSAERTAVVAVNELLAVAGDKLDIDTALKIATLANKAERRGDRKNQAIGGVQGGVITISLNQNFLNNLQNPPEAIIADSTQQVTGAAIKIDGATGLDRFAKSRRPEIADLNKAIGLNLAVKTQGQGFAEAAMGDDSDG